MYHKRPVWISDWSSQLHTQLKQLWNSGLNGIQTRDLCDTGAVLYQLSNQAIWELVTLWIRNIPVEVKDANEYYMKDHIFELGRKIWISDWSSQLHTQLKQLCVS